HQQDATIAPALPEQGMEPIDRRTPDRKIGRVGESLQEPQNIVSRSRYLRVLAGQQLDLPAPQPAGTWHEGPGSRRPAVLKALRRPLVGLAGQCVDDHPPFVESKILDTDAKLLAHKAVGAIAADQIARPDREFASSLRTHGQR